jgi:hypothetical protein
MTIRCAFFKFSARCSIHLMPHLFDPSPCSVWSWTTSSGPSGHFEGPEETIEFDYCLYALGAALPDPTNPWSEHPNIPLEVVHDHTEHGLGSKSGPSK